MKKQNTQKQIILIGSGGHAEVVYDLLKTNGSSVYAVSDQNLKNLEKWNDIKVMKDEEVFQLNPKDFSIANGLGGYGPNANLRLKLSELYEKSGFIFLPLVHKTAFISKSTTIDYGVQVMSVSVIQAKCEIKKNVLINTATSVDHDVKIGKNSIISPGVTICGSCNIGENVFIGAGSTIINGISIGDNAFIRAGTLVKNDVPANSKK